jgi:hypothetical protein
VSADVTPAPCAPLQGTHGGTCPFPTDTLAVDEVTMQRCSYTLPRAPAAAVPGPTSLASYLNYAACYVLLVAKSQVLS